MRTVIVTKVHRSGGWLATLIILLAAGFLLRWPVLLGLVVGMAVVLMLDRLHAIRLSRALALPKPDPNLFCSCGGEWGKWEDRVPSQMQIRYCTNCNRAEKGYL